MRVSMGILAAVVGLGACVPGQTGTSPMSHACIGTVTGPDGKPQQAVIEADDAGAAALLCEGDMATEADIARAMLGGGPVSKADKVVVRTAPVRPQVTVPAPAPVQSQPARVSPATPGARCGLKMVGGTGYVCASN